MDSNRGASTRYVGVIRALALLGGAGALGCSGPPTAPTVPGYTVEASSRGGYCVCCPSGDWSGQCVTDPVGPADGGTSGSPQTAPDGQRWCTTADLIVDGAATTNPTCPIAGPLPPPELERA